MCKRSEEPSVGRALASVPVAVRGSETYTATEDGGRWASLLHSASGSEDTRRQRSSWSHCSDWRPERTHRSSRAGATVPAAMAGWRMRMESGAARSSRSLIVSLSLIFSCFVNSAWQFLYFPLWIAPLKYSNLLFFAFYSCFSVWIIFCLFPFMLSRGHSCSWGFWSFLVPLFASSPNKHSELYWNAKINIH